MPKKKPVKKPAKKPPKSKKSKKGSKKKVMASPAIEIAPLPPPPPQPSQGEFIFIHVGQAGVQIGSACWELFCLEHGINPNGTVHQLTTSSTSIFSTSQMEKYVPRALLVDTEPSVIDEIRHGAYRNLFSSQNLLSGTENAASNFASGFYGVGRKLSQSVLDRLATLTEDCSSLQGIAVFRSVGGGTGSGMGTGLLESIKNRYPSKTVLDFNVYPAPRLSPVIVEPYNAVLGTHFALDLVNCTMLYDNNALYNICSKLNVPKPTYTNLNRIIALVSSGMTSSLRFEGSLTSNLSELLTNLIPWPRLHFPLITQAPMVHDASSLSANTQLAGMCFDQGNQMVMVDPRSGKYLSVCMMFRGNLTPTDVNTTIAFIQRERTIPVMSMNSPLFKFGLCYRPPTFVPNGDIAPTPKVVTTLSNNTAVRHCWTTVLKKYDTLLKKRAFLHHYVGEGIEEGIFSVAKENVSKLITEYEEVEKS